ncbi:choice-of-anchor tandem repeat GloVer-containing protein [Undibacterium sp. Di27W]|uniref:choice-of-anchor tandem repeat GloVer-containing protein n=1 Tax=Undibacterium sp. Di27W TaxID=3413036 RepID=UPI003BF17D97
MLFKLIVYRVSCVRNMTALNYLTSVLAFCLFTYALSAQGAGITPEFLPGLASNGRTPVTPMVQAPDGSLYGTTKEGGLNNHGTLYRVVPGTTPSVSPIYGFDKETYSPDSPMVVAGDSRLYGITSVWRKLYQVKLGPTPTVNLFPFYFEGSDEADTVLVQASDGALYGTIRGNPSNAGGIYRITPGAKPITSRVWTFEGDACSIEPKRADSRTLIEAVVDAIVNVFVSPAFASSPMFITCQTEHLRLVAASDGNLYGATRGGKGSKAFLYRIIPGEHARAEKIFMDNGKDSPAALVPSSLVLAKDGRLYGTMAAGGKHGLGAVFVINATPKPVATILLSITPEFRNARLEVAGKDGRLYGISRGIAKGCGGAFVLTPGTTPNIKSLLPFTTEGVDYDCTYVEPEATLVAGADGVIYGTLLPGRVDNNDAPGGIFRITTGATPSAARILSFTQQLGYQTRAPLMAASDGNLYGTTTKGGENGKGSIFKLTPGSSTLTSLFSFDADIIIQSGGALTKGIDGALYGGARTCCETDGLLFKVSTGIDPHVSTFYSFHSNSSAGGPDGALAAGNDGYLYGVAPEGGERTSLGIFYKVKTGVVSVASSLYEFKSESEGSKPDSTLVAAGNGRFYGIASQGGAHGMGSVFELIPGRSTPFSKLYSFDKKTGYPQSKLVLGADGQLYGTTYQSKDGCGIIYRIAPGKAGSIEILHTFDDHSCWLAGRSELVAAGDGAFYLATTGNSSDDDGKILKITTGDRATVTSIGSFSDGNRFTQTKLFAGREEDIYGLAYHSGDYGGILFRISSSAKPGIATLFSFDAKLSPDSMVLGKDGNFYGTSKNGGEHSMGALLRYKPGNSSFDLLYSFNQTAGDGVHPNTPLMLHSDGYFYGMTTQSSMRSNGRASLGRVFRFRPK